jgi:N6-adenosine-specific RNA methylase IME4/ADP-ribose pyrophosphatase YjhB (NUDIX family)
MSERIIKKQEIIKIPYCQITENSLCIQENIGKEQWDQIGIILKTMEKSIQFWIGDWIRFGEKKWGKMYKEAEEITGLENNTLRHIKSVSDNIDSCRRRHNLSYSHHAEIVGLNEEQQEKLLDKAESENLSVRDIRQEVKQIKRQEQINNNPEMPDDVFEVVYADPPWQYNNSGFEMSAENKYPTMSIEDMKQNIKFKTSENAILFLWVTNPLLYECFELINEWGFEYKTNFVWTKERHTAGFYIFGKHELLLICTKGNNNLPKKKYKSIILGENIVHSKKPEIVYEMIEEMYPHKRYLEVFARKKRVGWKSYGNEI